MIISLDPLEARMQTLARTFPSLERADGIAPRFEARALDTWQRTAAEADCGTQHAARFVLSVWNHTEFAFDLHAAMGVWDTQHRAAFLAWARKPWWA